MSFIADRPSLSLGLFLIAGLLVGALLAGQYGEAIDEETYYQYGKRSLAVYQDLLAGKEITPGRILNYAPSNLRFYGTAYLLLGGSVSRVVQVFAARWTQGDIWHLINFMTFLLGGCFLYTLCARLMSRRAALLAAGLFLTQPLLWGHAFINPKDIPFMVFFLAAVTAGIQMADHYTRASLGDSIFWSGLRDRKLILHLVWAAICLGLCVSVRVLGPAAGLIVAAYLFWRAGLKSIPILILYFGIAAVVSFSTWPNLWGAPIHRFIESIRMMANFPWEGTVLFNGIEYPSDQLPRSYLPALFGLQFTEPALLLFGLGLVGVGRFFLKESPHRLLASLVAGWFFLPVLAAILFRPVMYDNFRQFLFIVPAGFILAGIGLDLLLPLVRNRAVATALVLLIYAPGLLSLVSLHPYQYVYYNGFAGGVQGAFRRYEMDYWMTSYRQAARFLNETAEPEARIAVSKHPRLLRKYAREDLLVEDREQACRADYVVINTRHSLDLRAFPDEPVVYNVGRDRALFVVVKKLIHCKAQALD